LPFSFIKIYRLVLFFSLGVFSVTFAKEYSPSDVYAEASSIENKIKQWKAKQGLSSTWVNVAVVSGYKPRHVFQKAIEILDKISLYRVNILQLGPIPRNYSVGREITPNEVFIEVKRIHEELVVMLQIIGLDMEHKEFRNNYTNKVPSDVFSKLSEVSIAMDELLGIRGISPSDVYMRSQQIVDYASFLRRSQNSPLNIEPPVKTTQKSPNHSLEAVRLLLVKINRINTNLLIDPVKIIEVPRRVIEPTDVYGSMGIVLAEMQRLQHQLGLEKFIPEIVLTEGKAPDDVIFNTQLATLLLPDFSDSQKIQSFNKALLYKTPNHVFSLTSYLINDLERFARFRGINLASIGLSTSEHLESKHVYTKALEVIDKIVKMRENSGLGRSAIPNFPVREITPQEVYNLTLRIDEYLSIIYKGYGMSSTPWITSNKIQYFRGKTPTDVFDNMLKINHLLEAVLGSQGHNVNDLFDKLNKLNNDINQILSSLSLPVVTMNDAIKNTLVNITDIGLNNILQKLNHSIDIIAQIKKKEGIVDNARIKQPRNKTTTMYDVYRLTWQVEAELAEFKLMLGIEQDQVETKIKTEKTLLDVYHDASLFEHKLLMLPEKFLTIKNKAI